MARAFRKRESDSESGQTTAFSLETIRRAKAGTSERIAALTFATGQQTGRIVRLGAEAVELGRSVECAIIINGRGVSRHHARIAPGPGGAYIIADLVSTNGVVINDQRVERQVLADGDRIQLGPETTLKFAYEEAGELAIRERRYEESIRDDLTGLHNRRYFLRALEHELSYADRHGEPISLLMVDIDRFKAINDRYGHHAGDEVLSRFAHALSRRVRAEDVVARLGGEEFAVILRAQGAVRAIGTAERLRKMVAEIEFEFAEEPLRMSVSIGVATGENSTERTLKSLLAQADERLYEAKQAGRDQVIGPPVG